jgi:multidrug efflux pump
MRFDNQTVLGIGVTMAPSGDVVALGKRSMPRRRVAEALPAGLKLVQVASMPHAVSHSVDDFVEAVAEAIGIVLVVSLISLGLRTGMVVVISIPLVLAATALFMYLFHIGLHKVSLGTLILALGLLVDDAIIAVETMAVKLEQGFDRLRAAAFAYTSTAFPMLTGTLVTVSGFLPIALAKSATGEYTRSIFEVSAIALLLSWLAAVIVIPLLGYHILSEHPTRRAFGITTRLPPAACRSTTTCLRHAVLSPPARLDRLVRRSPWAGAGRDPGGVRGGLAAFTLVRSSSSRARTARS